MVNLGEVLGALISQVNKGRAQADKEIVEIAEAYKEDPCLSSFSVPRMVLDEVVLDLKISVAVGPSRGVSFTPEGKLEILDRIEKLVEDLPKKYHHVQSIRKDLDIWKPVLTKISEELSEIVLAEVEVKPKSVTASAATVVLRQILQGLIDPKSRVTKRTLGSFVQEDVPQMETFLKSEIEKTIDDVVKTQPPPKDRFEVLVSASDLKDIPSDRITTVKLTLRESDLSWADVEGEDGKIEKKLVTF